MTVAQGTGVMATDAGGIPYDLVARPSGVLPATRPDHLTVEPRDRAAIAADADHASTRSASPAALVA